KSAASTIPEYPPPACTRRSRTVKRDGASTPIFGPPGQVNRPELRSSSNAPAENEVASSPFFDENARNEPFVKRPRENVQRLPTNETAPFSTSPSSRPSSRYSAG